MCITFLFTNDCDSSIKYKVILINNRDEFYSRKTLKAEIKEEKERDLLQIYGTDVETKVEGTWLAIAKRCEDNTIKIGNLLNVPGEIVKGRKEDLKGRGPIAIEFVQTNDDIETHNKKLCDICTDYNSFNFLSVEISNDIKTYFTSNATQNFVELPKGFSGYSNSPVESPLKKVIFGTKKFEAIVKNHKNDEKDKMINALVELLKCEDKYYPDEELLKRRGHDAEDFSSIHVRHNQFYGTRTRTIILVDEDNNIEYIEETMLNQDPENSVWEVTKLNC
jgi:uncharacterized protein with NRDE domain